MKKIILFFLYLVVLHKSILVADLGKTENKESIDKFSSRINETMTSINTISFSFRQNTYFAKSTQTVVADVSFRRPDSLKVIYTEPQHQEITFSNGYLYTYIPAIKQATMQQKDNFSDLLGITHSIIFSTESFGKLKKDFNLNIETGRENSTSIYLESKSSERAHFEIMEISFSNKSLLPEQTIVKAPNIRSVTVFDNYTLNPPIGNKHFEPDFDKDINVIEIP